MLKTKYFILPLIALLFLSSFNIVSINKLKKGFDALRVYNYFEAKSIFNNQLEREPAGASFGLSLIFSRNDNPFFHLDSAYKYILMADSAFYRIDDKKKIQLSELGIDRYAINMQYARVDSLVFESISKKGNPDEIQDFIQKYPNSKFLNEAINHRNNHAFALAKETNTAESYNSFIKYYPEAIEIQEAKSLYEQRLYEESTSKGSLEQYRNFISNNPQSPFIEEAQYAIFEKSTKTGDALSYYQFIQANPDNKYVENAWRKIFSIEVRDFNARSIAAFSIKYPDYPFTEELRRDFEYAVTEYYPIEENGKWGFIDEKGAVRIMPEYEFSENFREGLALVSKKDRVGFINKSGEVVVPFIYDDAYSFKNGFALVENDGKFGIVDRSGNEFVKTALDESGEYSEGLFYIAVEEKYGYLNRYGKMVISLQYDDATDFYNGRAIVEKNGNKGIIDSIGNIISDFQWEWIEPFADIEMPTRIKKDNKFGLISREGNIVVPPVYDALGDFHEGLALAANEDKYGFINIKADTIIPFNYNFSQTALKESFFKNGYAKVYQKGKTGLIDSLGNRIFPAIFDDLGYFSGTLIPVSKNNKWGYADRKVNLVIPYNFESAENFVNGFALVKRNGKFGMIDSSGIAVIPFMYNEITPLDSNLFLVKDTAFGLINKENQQVLALEFAHAELLNSKLIRFSTDDEDYHYYDYRKARFIWRKD